MEERLESVSLTSLGRGRVRERLYFLRVKKITMKTVEMPNTEPMTGPAIQAEESLGRGVGVADAAVAG